MNELTVFNNELFGEIRTTVIDGDVWFVGKDVAKALGYKDLRRGYEMADEDDRKTLNYKALADSAIGKELWNGNDFSNKIIVNESGLYSMIFGSNLSTAKEFKHWVTSEVLPSIRKHGLFAMDEVLQNPDLLINALTELKKEREEKRLLESQKEELQIELDASKEWYSIKRMEKLNPSVQFDWRLLKKESVKLHKEPQKVFDANYGEVNSYHIAVWESLYFDSINY